MKTHLFQTFTLLNYSAYLCTAKLNQFVVGIENWPAEMEKLLPLRCQLV